MIRSVLIVVIGAGLVACADVDPPWQLRHDRIIAVRAEPPGLLPGEQAALDALVTTVDDGPSERAAMLATVVSPESLAGALSNVDGGWVVTCPDDAALAAARAELSLPPDAPVPLQVGLTVAIGDRSLAAIKVVWLGEARVNPPLGAVTVAGVAPAGELTVPVGTEVALSVEVASADTDEVDWLTSVGELDDEDDAAASLLAEEAADGHLAVVVRAEDGGVAWGWWTLRASP